MEQARYWRLLPWAIAAALAVLLVFAWFERHALGVLLDLPAWTIPAALAAHIGAHLAWAARLSVVSRAMDDGLPALPSWGIVTSGTFAGSVTPGRIGGEALKLGLLMKRGLNVGRASRILLVDRAFDLVFFIVVGSLSVALLPRWFGADGAAAQAFALAGTLFLAAFIAALAIALWSPLAVRLFTPIVRLGARVARRDPDGARPFLEQFIQDLRGGMHQIGRRPRLAAAAAGLTVLNWAVEFVAMWSIIAAFGYFVPYYVVAATASVLILVANIPITPGGSGVAEGAAVALLTPLAPGISPLFAVVWRASTYYYDLIVGALVAAFMLRRQSDESLP